MKYFYTISLVCLLAVVAGCNKDTTNNTVTSGGITVKVNYKVGNQPLIFDTVAFTNEAGNQYNVEKLQYYLSGFRFYKDNKLKFTSLEVFYLDARVDSTATFALTKLAGMHTDTYDSVSFYIGVDPVVNISNSLPQTLANIDMGWPDMMGGGYHFLKMEGHWKDNGSYSGYAMHMGSNYYQAKAGVKCSLVVGQAANATLSMTMNINEWFSNPHTYNFATDGVFTMGNAVLMQKLTDNGADVFHSN